jgi:nicotinate-nucleotide adenylyltransferase
MSRIGLFGGSFNPVHVAHLILAECVAQERRLDRVLFIPARLPPHKPSEPLAPTADRLRMVELAVAGNPAFEVSPVEVEREGPSYTLTTVQAIAEGMPEAELFLILGGDSVRDLCTWWRAQELVRCVDVIALDRPGAELDDHLPDLAKCFGAEWALPDLAKCFGAEWAERVRELRVRGPLLQISASDVRRRACEGRSIRYLVPEAVRQYIAEKGLY